MDGDNIELLERADLTESTVLLQLLQEANADHVRRFIRIALEIKARLDARETRAD